jgi:hypothetical protein
LNRARIVIRRQEGFDSLLYSIDRLAQFQNECRKSLRATLCELFGTLVVSLMVLVHETSKSVRGRPT